MVIEAFFDSWQKWHDTLFGQFVIACSSRLASFSGVDQTQSHMALHDTHRNLRYCTVVDMFVPIRIDLPGQNVM